MSIAETYSAGMPVSITSRLRVPLIAAPMFRVSGPDLVNAACAAGIIGCFPTINAPSTEHLETWLEEFSDRHEQSGGLLAPWGANVVMRDPRAAEDIEALRRCPPEIAIASVGSPRALVEALRGLGTMVLSDVATLHQARRAIEDGADGLILLSTGAGGNTGSLNPFAFVRAVRAFWSGPLVLAGGLIDGVALKAMRTLGCDLGYAGTRMIAATESLADQRYQAMVAASTMDDIVLTRAFTGLDTNMLSPSIREAGLDLSSLPPAPTPEQARLVYSDAALGPRRWKDILSAGHSVSGVGEPCSVAEIVDQIAREYAST